MATVSGQVNGGSGADTLIGFNGANQWSLTGIRAGNVNTVVPFADIENLTGGTGIDQFMFTNTSDGFGTINGGTGVDTLDYSLSTSSIEINIALLSAPKMTAFSAIESLIGSSASDRLVGAEANNAWTISGLNSGKVGVYDFASIETLNGGSLVDTFTLTTSLAAMSGGISGGDGIDTVVGFNTANQWSLLNLQAENLNGSLAFNGIENLTGNAASDTFTIASSADGFSLLNGGTGSDLIDYSSFVGPITFDLANQDYPGFANYSGIESILGSTSADTLMGASAANTWTVSGSNSGLLGALAFASFENLLGGTAVDTFTLTSATAQVSGQVSGNDGVDTLIGFNATTLWNLKGLNSGSIVGALAFTEFENLTGGTGEDTFQVGSGADAFNVVNAGTGTDTVDYSNYGSPVSINLATKVAPAIASLNAFESLVGSNAEDILIGSNAATSWTITGGDAGNVGTINFSSFENLSGGTLADTFSLSAANSALSGKLKGGDGVDTVVGFNSANTWNLDGSRSGDLNGVIVFSDMENLTGGTSSDNFLVKDLASGFGNVKIWPEFPSVGFMLNLVLGVRVGANEKMTAKD